MLSTHGALTTYLAIIGVFIAAVGVIARVFPNDLRDKFLQMRARLLWSIRSSRKRRLAVWISSALLVICGAIFFRVSRQTPISVRLLPDAEANALASAATSPKRTSHGHTVHGVTLVAVPAGANGLGCCLDDHECGNDELPFHRVTFRRAFLMASTEITVEQYFGCVQTRICPHLADTTIS